MECIRFCLRIPYEEKAQACIVQKGKKQELSSCMGHAFVTLSTNLPNIINMYL